MAVSRSDYNTLDEFLAALGNDSSYQAAQAQESTWTPQRNAAFESLQASVMNAGPGSMGKNVVQPEMPNPVYDQGIPGGPNTAINPNEVLQQLSNYYNQNDTFTPEDKNSGDWLVLAANGGVDGTVGTNLNAPFAPAEGAVIRPDIAQQYTANQQTQEDNKFFDNLQQRTQDIANEKDLDKREQLLLALKSDYEAASSKELERIREGVLAKYNVRDLEKMYNTSMQMDAQVDPAISKGKPSNETMQIARQLKEAEILAKGDMQLALKENPRLESSKSLVDNFFKFESAKITRERTREERNLDKQAQLDLNRELKKQDKADAEAEILQSAKNGTSAAQWKVLDAVYPNIAGNQDEQIKSFMSDKKLKSPEYTKAITDTLMAADKPMGLIIEAVRGNAWAHKAAVAQESAATGRSQVEIDAELNKMRGIANNPAELKAAIESIYPRSEKKDSPYQQALGLLQSGKNKIEEANIQEARQQFAVEWMSKQHELGLQKSVEHWPVDPKVGDIRAVPDAAKTIQEIKRDNGGKPVSADEFIQSYISMAPDNLKAQHMADIRKYLGAAVDTVNKASYGNVGNADDFVNRLVARNTLNWYQQALRNRQMEQQANREELIRMNPAMAGQFESLGIGR